MPQLRRDPVLNRWVIISTERVRRPSDFIFQRREIRQGGFCPFCEGNEAKTPSEILAFRGQGGADQPGWSVRVVPNKFPALAIEGDLGRRGVGFYDMMNGVGAHEVVIETSRHETDITGLAGEEIASVFTACRMRSLDLKKDQRLRYVLIFKNCGEGAGASLEHTHSQIIATPVTPKRVKEKLAAAAQHYQSKERCIFCDILRQELDSGERVIQESTHFVAMAPFAACFPFETWIIPRRHGPDFDQVSDEECRDLAAVLHKTLDRINRALDNPPYNYLVHTAPNRVPRPGYWQTIDRDYHWHLEIVPRVTGIAGFEFGTGFYINPTPPEEAAAYLRDIE